MKMSVLTHIHPLTLLCAFAVLFSCTPGEKQFGGVQNNADEIIVTGDALDVSARSAILTGYANLPLELGDAVFGMMCDCKQSFEDAKTRTATELDVNNKFTIKIQGLESSTTYYYKAFIQNGRVVKYGSVLTFTTKEYQPEPLEAVDMGLSVKWASFNLGADAEEDYGAYYAWGETETKENYSWESYKFGTSDSGPFTKYNTKSEYGSVDNKTVLDPEDDVAHVKLGGNWRMPTEAEWSELHGNCTWTWTDNYNGTGVAGRIFTSNVEGYKDKSIFLPVAGYRYDANLYNAGSRCYYWSSSLNTRYPYEAIGCEFYFFQGWLGGDDRYLGFSVRPVSE